jgi:hypothetical protein
VLWRPAITLLLSTTIKIRLSIAITAHVEEYPMRTVFSTLTLMLMILAGPVMVHAHPAEGHETNSLARLYSSNNTRGPEWDFNDITRTTDKPPIESLTQLERYMLAGTTSSSLSNGSALGPWVDDMFILINKYYEAFGTIPEEFNPTEMRKLPDLKTMPFETLSIYSNPLTAKWAKLNARSFSPGDLYIRPLTQPEMRYYANLNPIYDRQWYRGEAPGAGSRYKSRLAGKVYYVRMYGLKGVIREDFYFLMAPYD